MNKIVATLEEAVAGIPDGASILVGGFGGGGTPNNLVNAVVRAGPKNLTIIANGFGQVWPLLEAELVRHFISSFPLPWEPPKRALLERMHAEGRVTLEIVPQGTLVERIRAGGAGIPAFYCNVGAGTELAAGKETRAFNGRTYLLETAISADVALIKGHRVDPYGNLTYRLAARNFNPIMATAGRLTIAEVEETVELGVLRPDEIITPAPYVHRAVRVPKQVIWTYMGPRGASPARASVERGAAQT